LVKDWRVGVAPASGHGAARTPAKIGTGLHNVWLDYLPGDLKEVLEGVVCPESKRSLGLARGCSAAAAGARILASWWLGQDHTRVCKLTGCERKL
jgi:hypothetical protein